jgi:hypothetical protein
MRTRPIGMEVLVKRASTGADRVGATAVGWYKGVVAAVGEVGSGGLCPAVASAAVRRYDAGFKAWTGEFQAGVLGRLRCRLGILESLAVPDAVARDDRAVTTGRSLR